MTHWKTMCDKDYLYVFHLGGREVVVEIERVRGVELIGEKGKRTKKPAIWFVGKEKPLALNMTNGATIAALYGPEVESWIGKKITLYPTTTEFGGKTCECIRIRPTIPTEKAARMREPGEEG